MPIYEFVCKKCNTQFETLIGIGKEKSVTCIACGNQDLQKCVSAFGIGGGSSRTKSSSTSCSTCSSGSCSTCQ